MSRFKKGGQPHNKKWTDEAIATSAVLYRSRTEWSKAEPGAYSAAKKQGRLDHFCSHMRTKSESLSLAQNKYSLEECKADALQYNNKGEWQRAKGGYYRSAYDQGFLDECCRHMDLRYLSKTKEESRTRKNARTRTRNLRKIQRTPLWLNDDHMFAISEIYELRKLRSEATGVEHHVDHIVPLQGKTVSGLHVPWNLQVIPASENLSKSNSFAA